MAEDTVWSDWDPFLQVLKVAFVNEGSVAVFTYRLCPECGVSMDRTESTEGIVLWTCAICGYKVRELEES